MISTAREIWVYNIFLARDMMALYPELIVVGLASLCDGLLCGLYKYVSSTVSLSSHMWNMKMLVDCQVSSPLGSRYNWYVVMVFDFIDPCSPGVPYFVEQRKIFDVSCFSSFRFFFKLSAKASINSSICDCFEKNVKQRHGFLPRSSQACGIHLPASQGRRI